MRRTSDYQGWSNWETWNTALMMDNEQDLYNKAREVVRHGVDKGWSDEEIAKRLQDWAARKIIAPHNRDAIKDAQEWNDIPKEERLDYHFEDLKDKNPEAADLVNSFGFGPDVDDTEPTLIREDLVNWDEIVQGIKNEFNENEEYERQEERKKQLTPYDIVHWNDERTKMMDAWLSHHGVDPHADSFGDDRPRSVWGHQQWVPIDLIKQNVTEYGWPHGFGDATAKQIEQDGGWNYSTRDLGEQTATALQRGEAVPWQQETMEAALKAKRYTPEEAQQIMRQRYQYAPHPKYPDQRILVDTEKPPKQPDPSIDQPGDFTLPEDWHTGKTANDEDPWGSMFAQDMANLKFNDPSAYYELRRPFIVGYNAIDDPDPAVWIGQPGEYHHSIPREEYANTSPNKFYGEIWENTNPPVFRNADGRGFFDDYAIPHAERAYYQQQGMQKRASVQWHDYESNPKFYNPRPDNTRPALYDWRNGVLHVGAPGSHHQELADQVFPGDMDEADRLMNEGFQENYHEGDPEWDIPSAFYVGAHPAYYETRSGAYPEGSEDHYQKMIDLMGNAGHAVYVGTKRIASDGADYWTQSQDDWWGTQNSSLFNVNVPGETPGMRTDEEADSLHCPQCFGPMHGIECPSCGFKKTAGMTPNQVQEIVKGLRLPEDQSQIIHQFPDGYSIRQLQNYGDKAREGYIMHHCWAPTDDYDWSDEFDMDEPERFDPDPYDPLADERQYWDRPVTEKGDLRYMSLRDPNNIPKGSFFWVPPEVHRGRPSAVFNNWHGYPLYDARGDWEESGREYPPRARNLERDAHFIHDIYGHGDQGLAEKYYRYINDWASTLGGPVYETQYSDDSPQIIGSLPAIPGEPNAFFNKTAADLVPQDQTHVMPQTDRDTSWDDAQWDSDTFLDHNMINEHLKTVAQGQQYEDYLKRQQRAKDAEWPQLGVKEATLGQPEEISELVPGRQYVLWSPVAIAMLNRPGRALEPQYQPTFMTYKGVEGERMVFSIDQAYNANPMEAVQYDISQVEGWLQNQLLMLNMPPSSDMDIFTTNPSLDEPGDLTLPEHWGSTHTADDWYDTHGGDCPRCGRGPLVHGSDHQGQRLEWCRYCGWDDRTEVKQQAIPQVGDYAKSRDGHPVQIMGLHTEGENLFATIRYLDGYQPYDVGGRVGGTEEDPLWEHRVYDGKVVRPDGDYFNPKHWITEQGLQLGQQDALPGLTAKTAADNVPGSSVSDSGHWVWLDGHVGMGGIHSDIAESLAHDLGYDDSQTNYLSNWIARGHCPEDMAVAVGTLKNSYPYIWNSTRDRNHVWDAVKEHVDGQPNKPFA